jgi:transposase-like protein
MARMSSCDNISELSKELRLDRKLLYRWKDQLEATPAFETAEGRPTPEDPRDARLRQENSQLKRALADKSLEVNFSKVPCKK